MDRSGADRRCGLLPALGPAISANTSSITHAIAQIEAMRTTNHLVGQAQTMNVRPIGVIVCAGRFVARFLSWRGAGRGFQVADQPVKVEKLKGGWISGPNVLLGQERTRPQLTCKDAVPPVRDRVGRKRRDLTAGGLPDAQPPPAEEETVDVREIVSGGDRHAWWRRKVKW